MSKKEALKVIEKLKKGVEECDESYPYELVYTAKNVWVFFKTIEKALKSKGRQNEKN